MQEFKLEDIDFKERINRMKNGKHPVYIALDNIKKAKKNKAHPKIIERLESLYQYEIRLTAFILSGGDFFKRLKEKGLIDDHLND